MSKTKLKRGQVIVFSLDAFDSNTIGTFIAMKKFDLTGVAQEYCNNTKDKVKRQENLPWKLDNTYWTFDHKRFISWLIENKFIRESRQEEVVEILIDDGMASRDLFIDMEEVDRKNPGFPLTKGG